VYSVGLRTAQRCGLKAVVAWRDQWPKAGVAHGHVVVAHLAEPAARPTRARGHHNHDRRGGADATGGPVA
jgi:hypothetical protein